MRLLIVILLTVASAASQELAQTDPATAPSQIERLGLIGALATAVIYLVSDVRRKDGENKELTAKLYALTERVGQSLDRIETILDKR